MKWIKLKKWLELVIEEGYDGGYDKTDEDLYRGHFIAYNKVMDKIKAIEENNKDKLSDEKGDPLVKITRNTLLRDDSTPTGGVSFEGETVGDLLDELGMCMSTMSESEIIEVLAECGCTIQ